MSKTTIQIDKSTLGRLKDFRRYERESYDDVLNQLLDLADQETLSDEEIDEIQAGLQDIKKGRTATLDEVAERFGVKL